MAITINNGNAFVFIAEGQKELRRQKRDAEVKKFYEEMTSSDYEHLVATFLKWFPKAKINI